MGNRYDFMTFQSYAIGENAIGDLRRLTMAYGDEYLVIVDSHVGDDLIESIRTALTRPEESVPPRGDNSLGRFAGLLDDVSRDGAFPSARVEFYRLPRGRVTRANAEDLSCVIAGFDPQVVVAVGGSKCLDLARASLHFGDVYHRPRLVIVPTIIASNASSNGMSVLYDDSGHMSDFWNLPVFPECQIVDTALLSKAPYELLVSGIGDQVSSSIEAIHTFDRFDERGTWDPLCRMHHEDVLEILERHGAAAVEAAKRRAVTPEFEWVCHALTYYTGEQSAIAAAYLSHVLDEALVGIPEIARRPHGLVVGYGVLPEMVVCDTPDEISRWLKLYRAIGIPATLDELAGRHVSEDELLACCRAASDKIMASRAIVHIDPEEMVRAIRTSDGIVTRDGTRQ